MSPEGPWQVVRVGAEAAADLAALHARCFEEAWSAKAFAMLLAGGQGFVAGAAEPLGFALTRLIAGEAELLTLGVVPEARRQELGHRLMGAIAEWAKAAGAEAIFLEVAEDNEAARVLYWHHGFEAVGRRPGYYKGRDALTMRRSLFSG